MTTLGLDLGPNSIGWALLDEDSGVILDLGVRVFPEGVDKFDTAKEASRNEQRRVARGMRRQIARRARRKRRLRQALIAAGLYPADSAEQAALENRDPYELRACALREPLAPYEIGRAILHLNQRRGFQSNRKKDRGDSEVKGMLAEISDLEADMGGRTLGQYLNDKLKELDHTQRDEDAADRIRNRHTRRDMLLREFDAIWQAQLKHHPDLLTDRLRWGEVGPQQYPHKPDRRPKGHSHLEAFGLEGILFYQRPMYWPRSVVGHCELEPKEKRCPRADRLAQRFRLLQEVSNLKYIDPDSHVEAILDDTQRQIVLGYLAEREKATFDQIRKKLGFTEAVKFNIERGERSSLKGMITDWQIAKAVGKDWHHRPDNEKNAIAALLLDTADENTAVDLLVKDHGLTGEQADAVVGIDFPAGYIHLSRKALMNLLPHMDRGLIYMAEDESNSALHAAGYLRRDEMQRRLFDRLPDPRRSRDCPIGDIPNPVVKRALVELRKVVNAIIREHGKPDAVHVEMAREIRQGSDARRKYNKRIREREARRDYAADEIRKLKVRVSRDSILRYLFWEDQNHECVYCGNKISQAQLFGGEVDVDHILPYSRCLDDSQGNKVVCHRRCNADKGQRTPYEWLAASDPKAYEQVCQHVSSLMRKGLLPYGKYRKFLQKELELDDFIARQLVDTGYIARATVEYLRCLFDQDHAVLGLKGQLTGELRRQWGLNDILRDDGLDRKTRDDHRHHTVDAVVVALTNRRRLQQLTRIRKAGGVAQTGEALDWPWDGFREEVVKRVNRINVSHRVQRKVAGALHKDSFYGPTDQPDVFVKRKPLIDLSPSEIDKIRDPGIQAIVKRALSDAGITFGRGKKPDRKKMKEVLAHLAMPSGVPIKKVRLLVNEKTIQPIRTGRSDQAYVKPGSTHHLCLFEWDNKGKTKREAVFVTMLEAAKRIKCGEAIIQRTPPVEHPAIPSDARFVMSLSRGEMVLVACEDEEKLLVYSTAAQTSGQMWFWDHTDARNSLDKKTYSFKANTLNARKVTVDPLGRIRWAND